LFTLYIKNIIFGGFMVKKMNKNINKKLENKFKKMLGCDSARISNPLGNKLFLIIGYKKHTKDDIYSQWVDGKGDRIDFEYMEEKVIASGKNIEELIESAKYYKKLQNMSWEEYFLGLKQGHKIYEY
jgi:hypothetical protein